MKILENTDFFYNYSIFQFGKKVSFLFKKSVFGQSCFIASLFILLLVIGSLLDHTLLMEGINVGLLEHSTFWGFIVMQIIAPWFLQKSINKLLGFLKGNDVIDASKDLTTYISLLNKHTLKQTNISRLSFAIISLIGLACFAWNSFQNQEPLRFLGFDFWDSSNHFFGYWLTRVYKLYMWVFFLPAIIHIHLSSLFVLYKLLHEARREKFFKLMPYSQDEHAGAGEIIKIAINPPIPIMLVGFASVVSAFFIHGHISITPIIGLSLMSLLLIIIYLIPAIQLRNIIKSEKKNQLDDIARKQNALYFELVKYEKSILKPDDLETLNTLSSVFNQVKLISVWPYWKSILKVVGIINIPLIISLLKNVWPALKTVF